MKKDTIHLKIKMYGSDEIDLTKIFDINGHLRQEFVKGEKNKKEVNIFFDTDNYDSDRAEVTDFIIDSIEERGYSDSIEFKMVKNFKDEELETLVVIGNRVIKESNRSELKQIINYELNKIINERLFYRDKEIRRTS